MSGDCTFYVVIADLKISQYVWFYIKQYPGNLSFLVQRILELFTREVCPFLNKYATFMFVNKHFIYLGCAYSSHRKCCYNAKPSAYYFYAKT